MNNKKNALPLLKFRHSWRPEQQRVLDQLDGYLDDKRFHIVAAPGAGKTVIGLEVFNRLQLKTLAISPTTVVRNQWLERLNEFLPDEQRNPDWASTSLKTPLIFTASTYQGLFSFDKKFSGIKEEDVNAQYESLSHWFIEHEIKLLILDEAHHLKSAWWKVLMKLVNASNDLIIVSLTATPPYDASAVEWSRYQQLCGPIDEEISIPELVRSNSLCPHQDYIWMVKTDDKNISSLNRQKKNLSKFIDSLENHAELLYLLHLHHWLDEEREISSKDVLVNLDECFALLGLIKLRQEPQPQHLLNILEIKAEDIQNISVFGWEVLLQSFLDGSRYPSAKPITQFRETLATLLKSKYFLKYSRVSLDNSKKKIEAFNKTQERIKACFDITQVEYSYRANWMKLVILSDYIRDEKYQLALDGLEAPTGAYPIFHYFIYHLESELAKKTVLLTGRLSIIHKDVLDKLADHLPATVKLSRVPYSENADYVVLKVASEYLSAAFTKLHKKGDLLILIGTRSLLGEGWDAPHVNALILATQTGAYVTTNQIRGRAIRIDPENELKTASIWHIVAVAPDQPYNHLILHDLHKRFKTFAGLHASELRIESGIERLALKINDFAEENEELPEKPSINIIDQSNQASSQRLQDDIYNLQARWQNALEKVENHAFQSGLQIKLSKSKKWATPSHYIAKISNKHQNKSKGTISNKHQNKSKGTSIISETLFFVFTVIVIFYAIEFFRPTLDNDILLIAAKVITLCGSAIILAKFFYQLYQKRMTNKKKEGVNNNKKKKKTIIKTNNNAKGNAENNAENNAKIYADKMARIMVSVLQESGSLKPFSVSDLNFDIKNLDDFTVIVSIPEDIWSEADTILIGINMLLGNFCSGSLGHVLVAYDAFGERYIFPIPYLLGDKDKNSRNFLKWWIVYFPEFKRVILFNAKEPEGKYYLSKIPVEKDMGKQNSMDIVNFSEPYRSWLTGKSRQGLQNKVNPETYPVRFSQAVLTSLRKIKAISTQETKDEISIIEITTGYLRFSLNNANRRDNETFLTALSQLLEPIRQPRYILALTDSPQADEIISVPHVLGVKKEFAEIFLKTWLQHFPEYKKANILSTATELGRQYLLKAKVANYQDPEETNIRLIDRWQ